MTTGGPQDIAPYLAAAQAADQLAFALRLLALVHDGVIRPERFPRTVLVPVEQGRLEITGEVTTETLERMMGNIAGSALFISAQIMNRALEDTFGPHHPLDVEGPGGRRKTPEELGDREAAQEIVFMLRNAVSHDPVRPRWQSRGPRVGVFRVSQLDITFDTRGLDGTPVTGEEIGGLQGYLRLLQYCEHKIRRAAGAPEMVPVPARDWLQPIDLSAAVPPNATAVKFSYRLEPGEADAALFRTRADASPLWLRGPQGEAAIEIQEPQRIYAEIRLGTRLHLEQFHYRIGKE